jgi:hypothetical protein
MKTLIMILSALALTACIPVERNFPDVPEELKSACPDLAQVDPNTTKLSEVVRTVTDNYSRYHECQVRVDAWIEWYNTQKSIFDSVK